ncbi:MAG TPA: site-specific integrase [Pyrinomonadaceae bacterium]|jgi:integrase
MSVGKVYSKGKNNPKKSPGPAWRWDERQKKWWSYGYDIWLADGTRTRESGFFAQADAEAAVGIIRRAEKDKKFGFIPERAKPTVSQLVEKRIAAIANEQEKVRASRVLNDFLGVLPKNLKIDALNATHFDLFIAKRLKDGVKPQTVNRELNIVVAALNKVRGYYPILSQWIPPKADRPKASRRRRERLWATEERDRLIDHLLAPRAPEEVWWEYEARLRVGHVCKFALLTGARHGEIDRIRWEHVDFPARLIQIVGVKSQNRVEATTRYLKITDAMMEILLYRKQVSEDPFVFSKSGNTNPNFYKIIQRACERLDIPYGRNVDNGLVLHDARHTVVTNLLQAGVDLSTIGAITGHTDKSLILYYGHSTAESRARAGDVLDAAFERKISERPSAALTDEQLDAVAALYDEGKISRGKMLAILSGRESIPEDLLEKISAMAREP